jgi:hypothetical protein
LSLGFPLERIDGFKQQIAIMTLLANVILHLLVVAVDFWLHIRVHLFNSLAQLRQQRVHFVTKLF